MNRVVHFEIHAADPQKAVDFYCGIFGWNAQQWGQEEYWLLTTGPDEAPGINGAILKRRGPSPEEGQPVNTFCCTMDVENLDATVAKVTAAGGSIALPKMPVPGIGWLAYAKDPDGNIFGMMQNDPQAR